MAAQSAQVRDGWLEVTCDAHDRAAVYIAVTPVGVTEPAAEDWLPAFRDWDSDGRRVAKIRPPATGSHLVWLDVDRSRVRLSRPVSL